MSPTPNHGYNTPSQGAQDWDVPVNENFADFDVDIEIRDSGTPGSNNYDPQDGAKYLDTDSGLVYEGDGSGWTRVFMLPRFDSGTGNIVLGETSNTTGTSGANIVTGGANNSADGPHAAVGGGNNNEASGQGSVAPGGRDNVASGVDSVVGGGVGNDSTNNGSTVAGGKFGTASGTNSTVAGGAQNEANANNATVGGGFNNLAAAEYATIAGGAPADFDNQDTTRNVVHDNYGTIGGGGNNQAGTQGSDTTDAPYATVAGGDGNDATGEKSTISGGVDNLADSIFASVGGGSTNHATAESTTVGGGDGNEANTMRSTIAGGKDNLTSGSVSTIGGGFENRATEQSATVGGGFKNEARASHATVAGGAPADFSNRDATKNVVYDDYGTIGGGGNNQAGTDNSNQTNATYATVSGGENNAAKAGHASIGGGTGNTVNGDNATVGGGRDNTADTTETTVAGGASNTSSGLLSTVGGGFTNEATANYTTISGGRNNDAKATDATVPGGSGNTASGEYSIAMGRNATASQDGSFVVGDSSSDGIESLMTDEARFQGDLRADALKNESGVWYYEDDTTETADWSTYYDTANNRWEVRFWNPNFGIAGAWISKMWVTENGDVEAEGNKNFVETVDTDDGEKEVVYTATEAAMPRTEASGVASLEDGRAEIDLPEHFAWVTSDEEPLLVQTTPYGGTAGLKVVERSPDRIVVEDLDGAGDYEFAYTVKGTRAGREDKQVVREPTSTGVSPAPADD